MDRFVHVVSHGRGWYFHVVCDPFNFPDAILYFGKLEKHQERYQILYDRFPCFGKLHDWRVLRA